MPEPRFRSRTLRRVKKTLPSGESTVHHVRRNPKSGKCAVTGETLKGVPRLDPHKLEKLGKSKKRPERPFGGVLSSSAMRQKIKKEARENSQ